MHGRLEDALHFCTLGDVGCAGHAAHGTGDLPSQLLIAVDAEQARTRLRKRVASLFADSLPGTQHHESTPVQPQ
jgi:hypothetical protein